MKKTLLCAVLATAIITTPLLGGLTENVHASLPSTELCNVALNKPVISERGQVVYTNSDGIEYHEEYTSKNITDGNLDSRWRTETDISANRATYAVIDLLGEEKIDYIDFKLNWDKKDHFDDEGHIKLSISNDNNNWTEVETKTLSLDDGFNEIVQVNVDKGTRYIKIEWVHNGIWNGWGNILEVRAFSSTSDCGVIDLGGNCNVALDKSVIEERGQVNYTNSNGVVYQEAYTSKNITDGNLDSEWRTETDISSERATFAVIDLKKSESIKFLDFKLNWDKKEQFDQEGHIKISISNDNSNWNEITTKTLTMENGFNQIVPVKVGQAGRYVKIEWVENGNWNGWGNINEVRVYAKSDQCSMFPDVPKYYEHNDAIEFAYANQIINGYTSGENAGYFGTEIGSTRAEFTKMLVRFMFDDQEVESCDINTHTLSDINEDNKFKKEICIALREGFSEGFGDKTYRSETKITTEEGLKIIANAYDLVEEVEPNDFTPFVQAVADKNALPIDLNLSKENFERAKIAEILFRLEKGANNKEGLTLEEFYT